MNIVVILMFVSIFWVGFGFGYFHAVTDKENKCKCKTNICETKDCK